MAGDGQYSERDLPQRDEFYNSYSYDWNMYISLPNFNPLKTNDRPLYLKAQFVPRSKHFPSRL